MTIIKGTKGNDTLTGTDASDLIYGLAGRDVLDGGAGNDSLEGASGNDTYLFGIGSGQDTVSDYNFSIYPVNRDTIQLGNGIAPTDVIIVRGINNDLNIKINGTTDQLKLSDWFTSDAYKIEQVKFANGTLWDVAALLANLTDLATGGDDYLAGDSGANKLSGLKGNDIYIVDHAGDEVKEKLNEGEDTVEAEITYKLAANVENLTITGNDAINGTGNALNNSIYGNNANNILSGGFGDDVLIGNSGNDILNGGTGDDILFGLDEPFLDKYYKGDAGNPRLDGGYDNDILNGGAGNDELFGSVGSDIMNGGVGNDYLNGGYDNDILKGGGGDDNLEGGAGDDIFQLTTFSTDTIRDFSIDDDTIQLDNNEFTQLTTSGPLNAANFIKGAAAADTNDYVIYNKGTGELWYDADGSDPGGAQQIALLGTGTTHPALTFADIFVI